MRPTLRLPVVLASLLALAGCDNSGGEAPPGEDVAIESTGWGFIEPCFGGDDAAAMLDSVDAVNAWMEPCGAPNAAKQQQIVNKMNELDDSRRLMAGRVVLGGCVRDWHLRGLHSDGETVYVWILKEDTALHRPNTACTADIGWAEGFWIAAEGDVAGTSRGELWLGSYNPDLPGAPAQPGG